MKPIDKKKLWAYVVFVIGGATFYAGLQHFLIEKDLWLSVVFYIMSLLGLVMVIKSVEALW